MSWQRRGLIFGPGNGAGWMRSHAQIPTPMLLDKDRLRVFFSSRREAGVSRIGYVDLDARDPSKVLNFTEEPIIALGSPGSYDEFGLMPSCALKVGDEVWLYTIGWQRGQTVPYTNAIGLLISRNGGETFERPFKGPVLDRTPHEPFSTMSPYIHRSGGQWHAWYGSGTAWLTVDDKYEPVYQIKYATSADGITWDRPNILSIPEMSEEEATTRPCVVATPSGFDMWFSYRGSRGYRGGAEGYKMGFAQSQDGISWVRDDSKSGIGLGDVDTWDSEMIAYPGIIDTDYGRYLFYNGNGFGAAGFGYAIWTGH